MTCYSPLLAYKVDGQITFNKPFDIAKGFNIPCGQCIGCRLTYSRNWAIRCVHESQMHQENCFITLTFSPEALEKRNNPYSLDKREFQLFMKRLRKKVKTLLGFFTLENMVRKINVPIIMLYFLVMILLIKVFSPGLLEYHFTPAKHCKVSGHMVFQQLET